MLGNFLGSIFGCEKNNEWDEKPHNFSGSVKYTLPENSTTEEIMRCQEHAQDSLRMASMSKREQLEFLKQKTGL